MVVKFQVKGKTTIVLVAESNNGKPPYYVKGRFIAFAITGNKSTLECYRYKRFEKFEK